jgi:YD repeat-containing protein
MKDGQPGIIVHDQGVLREGLRTIGAPFRETPNSCPKALFVVEDEHMAFSYTNSWKLARSEHHAHLLRVSVRIRRETGKGLCQLDGSIRVNHVTVHTPTITTYNAFGEVASVTDAETRLTTFEYDPLGRVKKKTSPDGVATNTWDTAAHGVGKLNEARSWTPTRLRILCWFVTTR